MRTKKRKQAARGEWDVTIGLERLSRTPAPPYRVVKGQGCFAAPTLYTPFCLSQHPSSNPTSTIHPLPFPLLPPGASQTDPVGLYYNHFISPSTGTAAWANSDCVICSPPPTGTTVAQVTATDADDPMFGNNAKLIYSILQGEPYFSVEPKTGTWCWQI